MRFCNLHPDLRGPGAWGLLRHLVLARLLGRSSARPPGPPAPSIPPDLVLLRAAPPVPHLTWLGHASVLLALGGRNILVDPVWSSRVAWFFRRHAPPPLAWEQLPPIDLLLVTHNHWDHLDPPTIQRLDRSCTVVVPLGLGRWFCRRGFARVIELAWWEQTRLGNVQVSFVPAHHGSGRRFLDANRTLWGGYVLEAEGLSVYHAGDSAWFEGFREIGRRFPHLTAALLPIAGYDPRWLTAHSHTTPEEAARAFLEVGARWMVPIHWGSFQFSDEPLQEPVQRLLAWWEAQPSLPRERLKVLAVGETLRLS